MSDESDQNIKSDVHSHVREGAWQSGREESLFCSEKSDSFMKRALLRAKTSATSQSSIHE
jgi:hypothetical protein